MGYRITELNGKIFELSIFGDYEKVLITEARYAFLDYIKKHKLSNEEVALLINLEGLKGSIPPEDRKEFAKDFADLYKGIKTAVYSTTNYQNYYFEQKANSMGLSTLTFTSYQEALKWLEGDFDF